MNIMFFSPNQIKKYNIGHQLFRNEIAKQHRVKFFGPGYRGCPERKTDVDVRSFIDARDNIQCVMTYGLRNTWQFKGLGKVKIPKAHFILDFVPSLPGYRGWDKSYKQLLERDKYDVLFCKGTREVELLGEHAYLLPFSVDTNYFHCTNNQDKKIDVMCAMSENNAVYPNRADILQLIAKMQNKISIQISRTFFDDYVFSLNNTRIFVNSVNYWKYFNFKILEAIFCGCFVLTDKPADFEDLGFRDGKHLVVYTSIDDLKNKIKYFLVHDIEREEIAMNGMNFARECHSNEYSVRVVKEILEKYI